MPPWAGYAACTGRDLPAPCSRELLFLVLAKLQSSKYSMSGEVTSMYSANALYFSLVIKARIRADALSSSETMPTPCTKRRRVFMAAMTPLRSTWGARAIDGVVARAVLGDEAAAARAMRWLMEGGGAETASLSTIDKILVNPVTIWVFVGTYPWS